MRIRRAVQNDRDGLIRLLRQVNKVHYDGRPDLFRLGQKYTDAQLTKLIEDDVRPIFVAVDENKNDTMLGYAFCVMIQHLNDNILTDIKTLYIDDLCVDESIRGQHVGSSLYEYVLLYAREQDCYNVTLNVWALNSGAMKFYEHCGMKPQKIGMETILNTGEDSIKNV